MLCSTAASEQPQQVTVQTGKWLTENVKSVCVQNAFVKRRKRAARAKAKQVRLAMWKFSQDFLAAYIDATKPDPSLSRVVKSKYCRAPASVRRPLGNHKSLSQRWLPFSPQAEVNLLQKHICEHPELLEYVKRLEHLQNLFLNLNPDGTIPSKPSGCS